MMNLRNGVAMRRGLAGLAALACLAIGAGCETTTSNNSEEFTLEENAELREKLSEVESSLIACQDENSALLGQNADLASALDQAQSDLQVARSNASNVNAGGAFGNSNAGGAFAGIEGAQVYQRGDSIVVAVAGDVLFSSGQASLKRNAKQTLDRIASVLNTSYSGQLVRVEGYTDSDPIRKSKWSSNEHLSAERSLAVEKYLVSKGVNNDRIYAAAFGPSNPRATKQQSRRVEIVVLGAGS